MKIYLTGICEPDWELWLEVLHHSLWRQSGEHIYGDEESSLRIVVRMLIMLRIMSMIMIMMKLMMMILELMVKAISYRRMHFTAFLLFLSEVEPNFWSRLSSNKIAPKFLSQQNCTKNCPLPLPWHCEGQKFAPKNALALHNVAFGNREDDFSFVEANKFAPLRWHWKVWVVWVLYKDFVGAKNYFVQC